MDTTTAIGVGVAGAVVTSQQRNIALENQKMAITNAYMSQGWDFTQAQNLAGHDMYNTYGPAKTSGFLVGVSVVWLLFWIVLATIALVTIAGATGGHIIAGVIFYSFMIWTGHALVVDLEKRYRFRKAWEKSKVTV